ncbi:MAG: polyphosphate kinase 2 family protein [Bdellovibrionales bacterium]
MSKVLKEKTFPGLNDAISKRDLEGLELKMLRIQQGLWHSRSRAIIVFEGCDAAGKGGTIQRLTKVLDPRGFRVHSIGPPESYEQERHYLYRFWMDLPKPGSIAIFDRSWYGRVLAERVEKLTPKKRWHEAFSEINEFEAMLTRDGIEIIKIFLAIHPDEQLRRFEERLKNPYKQWKLTAADLEAHRQWDKYVAATDELLRRTDTPKAPWHLFRADSKEYARGKVLECVTKTFAHHAKWMESAAQIQEQEEQRSLLKQLRAAQRGRA